MATAAYQGRGFSESRIRDHALRYCTSEFACRSLNRQDSPLRLWLDHQWKGIPAGRSRRCVYCCVYTIWGHHKRFTFCEHSSLGAKYRCGADHRMDLSPRTRLWRVKIPQVLEWMYSNENRQSHGTISQCTQAAYTAGSPNPSGLPCALWDGLDKGRGNHLANRCTYEKYCTREGTILLSVAKATAK